MRECLPSVSVVVPVYNAEKRLEETLHSLVAIDYPLERRELIVVDNGSTDGTARILVPFSDRIRILREPERGRSRARNRGIAAASHEVVAFTDAECIASPNWLRNLVAPLSDPRVGISGGNIKGVRPCTPIQEFAETLWDQNQAINVYKPPYAITANWASPKKILIETGGFDDGFVRGEDVELAFRIQQAGYSIVYSGEAVISHHNPGELAELFKLGFKHGFYSVNVMKRHRPFLRQFGHRGISWRSYRWLGANVLRSIGSGHNSRRRCEAAFELGKKAGKLAGSIRFGALEL